MSEQEENQLATPPEEILVVGDAIPETTILPNDDPDEVEIVELTKKEYTEFKQTLSRLVGIVDTLTTRSVELARANNRLVEAVNNLPQNQPLINAIVAEVIAASDAAAHRVDTLVAMQIADNFLEQLDARPETVEESENTYTVLWNHMETQDDKGHDSQVAVCRYDVELGDYIAINQYNEKDNLIASALVIYLQKNNTVPEDQLTYFRHLTNKTITSTDSNAQGFDQFMNNTLNEQGALGDIRTSMTVSREYVPGSLLFTFTEATEGDETPFSYTCKENAPDDTLGTQWKNTDIDVNLAMVYISAIQSNGGVSGEDWYIVQQ